MKALVFVTHADCENKYRSLEAAGHEVVVEQYDNRPHHRHGELVRKTIDVAPDFAVFIGAVEEYHHRPVPSVETLQLIRAQVPFIHMCNDAADQPWWPMLELYDDKGCFDVQVAIDGSTSPINRFKNGMVALTPIDCRPYTPLYWENRKIRMSMIGGLGHGPRGQMVQGLISRGVLDWQKGSQEIRSYEQYAQILCASKIVFNHPMTGSGHYQHVKGRVIEAGFAGACLFERRGSPTSLWFLPGVDFIEYDESVDSVVNLLNTPESILSAAAENLRKRVESAHHPRVFWNAVLAKAGLLT